MKSWLELDTELIVLWEHIFSPVSGLRTLLFLMSAGSVCVSYVSCSLLVESQGESCPHQS